MTSKLKEAKIVILASEEFVPISNPLSGIFQFDQAKLLKGHGINVFAISISDPIAFFPLLVSIIRKIFRQKVYYKIIENLTFFKLIKLMIRYTIWRGDFYCWDEKEGIKILRYRIKIWDDRSYDNKKIYFVNSFNKALNKFIDVEGIPDLIHAHNSWFAGIAAASIKQKLSLKFCITEHSTYYSRNLIPKAHYRDIQHALETSNYNWFVSEELKNELQQKELKVYEFGICNNLLDPLFTDSIDEFPQVDSFTFINVAELTEKKGHSILIKAFKLVEFELTDVKLFIVGDGDLYEPLRQLILDLNLVGKVFLLGYKTRFEIRQLFLNSNAFVLPSFHETFGVVVIEALASGLPVIATKCGGPESLLSHENGILIPPGSIDELGKALKRMFYERNIYSKSEIHKNALRRFSSETFYDNMVAKYQSILDN